MSWTTERVKPAKRKKVVFEQTQRNTKFDEYIIGKYNELQELQEKTKINLQQQVDALLGEQKQLASRTSRGFLRRKKLIVLQLKRLYKKIEENECGMKIQDFKQNVLPYMEAYEREIQVAAVSKLRDNSATESLIPQIKSTTMNHSTSFTTTVTQPVQTNIMSEFLHDVENIPVEVKAMSNEICEECDDIMVLEQRSSILICAFCGNWKHYLDGTSSHMAYGEEVEFTAFAYLRMNHFNERLTYSQAKESTRINQEDVNKVMDRLIEHRITDVEKITMELTYTMMKELKMRHIYKQNAQLWCRITSKQPKRMSPEQEERLRSMFRAVNRLWPKYKPKERKNFLSYNYNLFKFCELLGMDDFCSLYKLLKGERKLNRQDEIFKQICEDPALQWQFIPSQ
jgi:Poxvirus Late Transcription Factor VLTF3 like